MSGDSPAHIWHLLGDASELAGGADAAGVLHARLLWLVRGRWQDAGAAAVVAVVVVLLVMLVVGGA